MLKKLSLFILLMVLTACSSISDFDIIEEITAPDYVSSSRARKLEITLRTTFKKNGREFYHFSTITKKR
jgi:hypothetical protein